MIMDIKTNWKSIKSHFKNSLKRNMFLAIASVNDQNEPTVTPIGSLFFNENQTGFYFEKFATKLNKHAKTNNKICVIAVNNSKWFWLISLFKGKFSSYPGVKLYGELGESREATEIEKRAMQRRVRITQGLKGHTYLWKDMSLVRDIKFTKAEKINLGQMTREL